MNENQSVKQVKSKERVQKHGEVFTPAWVVNDMLDLLPAEVWRPEETFLEPACGEGAFLVEIYRRKLQHINANTQEQWEWQAAIATSSIYGIELLEDNAKQCRLNLVQIFNDFYHNHFPDTQDENIVETIQFLIDRNIIQGNALTYRKCLLACGNECTICEKILFSRWTPLAKSQFKRKDYTFEGIIDADKSRQKYAGSLFDVAFSQEEYGLIQEFKPIHYKEIQYANH